MAKEMQQAYDPWKDMRTVYVPRMSRGEQATLQVGVNDKTYFVPKDQQVDVPAPVAEVVNEMLYRRKKFEENMKANGNLTPHQGT
ncbi:MAG: hypothetical protein IKH57_21260 [Clostridia bacterium]|nr:hypothetical protein [Clostridia bacterium]